MARREVIFEDADILFKNFAGEEQRREGQVVNGKGARNFTIRVPEEDAKKMLDDGWAIGVLEPREEGDEVGYWLKINVSYAYSEPRVLMYTSGRYVETVLHEDTISQLDDAEIISCDVIFTPWQRDEDSPIRAYLKELRVVIEASPFEDKYARLRGDDIDEEN